MSENFTKNIEKWENFKCEKIEKILENLTKVVELCQLEKEGTN